MEKRTRVIGGFRLGDIETLLHLISDDVLAFAGFEEQDYESLTFFDVIDYLAANKDKVIQVTETSFSDCTA